MAVVVVARHRENRRRYFCDSNDFADPKSRAFRMHVRVSSSQHAASRIRVTRSVLDSR